MKPIGTKELDTERLQLRRFKHSDAEAMFKNWASDPVVTEYLTWLPHKNIEETEAVLTDWIASYENPLYFQWAILLKGEKEPIGSIGIVRLDEKIKSVHVGYCIGQKWWNQGITTEALKRLIDFFFREVEVNRIDSRHDPRNLGSGKVMEKCDLMYEGTIKQGDWNNQGVCDYSIYGLVAEDYDKKA